jgi:hypothetical protein
MQKFNKPGLIGVCLLAGVCAVSLATQQDEMLWYRMKHFARRALLGKHTSNRMYHEEVRRKSVESFKNNPNRKEFLKKHPGFLEANPHLR